MLEDLLNTRLCEEYGCEYPLVAFVHTKDVVASVTNAGGIGVYGANSLTPDELRSDIRWIRERVGDKPFGVDLLLPASFVSGNREDLEEQIPEGHRAFIQQLTEDNDIPEPKEVPKAPRGDLLREARTKLDVILEEHVPIFASGLGSPAFILEEAHAAGTKVWGLVGLPRQARREIEAGIDLVIAQGADSGGHSGRIGTFSLVPAVVEIAKASNTPVLAAGGVTTGRHLVAAISLGAVGVWCGTIWQATNESETDMAMKQRLVESSAEDVVKSRASTGKPVAQIRSKWTDAWSQPDAPDPLPMPLQGMLVGQFKQAVDDHKVEDFMSVPSGTGVGFIDRVKPAAQVVAEIIDDAHDTIERMAGAPVGA